MGEESKEEQETEEEGMMKKRDFPVQNIRVFNGKEYIFYSFHKSKRIAERTKQFLDVPSKIVKVKEGYLVYRRREKRKKK